MNLDDVLAGLLAERYAPSTWWRTPPTQQIEDSELTCARRRREATSRAKAAKTGEAA
jgi:hypothetical protein